MKNIILILLLISLSVSGNAKANNLDSLFDFSKLDTLEAFQRGMNLSYIARDFKGSTDSAKIILSHAYKIAKHFKDDILNILLANETIRIKLKEKDYAGAYDYAMKCIKYGDKHPNKKVKLLSRDPLAIFYKALNNMQKKMEVKREKLKIAYEIFDSTEISGISYGLAYDLYQEGEYPESLQLFLDAYNYRITSKKKDATMAEYIGWAGNISNILKNYNKAVSYRLLAVKIIENSSLKDTVAKNEQISTSYRFIGSFYAGRKMYDSTMYYYNLAQKINEKRYKLRGYEYESFDIARHLYENFNPQIAAPYLIQTLDNPKINKYGTTYYWSVELGTKIFTELNDFNRLSYCIKWYFLIKDSIDKPLEVSAEDISTKYELEMQTKEKKATAKRELEKRNEEIFKRNLFAGFACIALLLLLLVYRNFRQKKKAHKEISLQKLIVELKNKEIIDSISYAKRLQNAILPPLRLVKEYFPNSFIIYKPKDIVAGDFYWMESTNGALLFAAADCTGHGVPGALVSVICNNGLNRSINEFGITNPGEILDKTRDIVIHEFEKSDEEVKDGMDISLCSLIGNKLSWAGANNPIWIIREKELIETHGNKQPIGQYSEPKPFTTHVFELKKGDTIYISTDGFQDQFGGDHGKKFKSANFKKLLLSIQEETMDIQKQIIEDTFENWKADQEQVDDVCVIGVKF
jgi:serine phosphatase RsbU (regulator of sigma subunit)